MRKPIEVYNPYTDSKVDVEPLMKLMADNGDDLPDELTKSFINVLSKALQIQGRLPNFQSIIDRRINTPQEKPRLENYGLTKRETEVFQYIANSNLTYKELANKLHIAQTTLRSHVTHITQKTGVQGKRGIKQLAMELEHEPDTLKETVFTILEICRNKEYK